HPLLQVAWPCRNDTSVNTDVSRPGFGSPLPLEEETSPTVPQRFPPRGGSASPRRAITSGVSSGQSTGGLRRGRGSGRDTMLRIDGLTRRFGDTVAVNDVEFMVPRGTMTGFVGGNGAGKTTTMRMIMGVLQPTAGRVLGNGREATGADRRTFGYMPEERRLYPKQPVLDQLVYLGRLQGRSAAGARRTATDLLDRFGLGERLDDKLESLSLGNQQRVQIAAAVIGGPELLVLDEPFSGLDPVAVDSMVDLLREHTTRG